MLQVQSGASTPKEFWTNSAFTYKIYFAFTLVTFLSLFTLNLFYPEFIFYLIDIPQKTIWSLQIWRLLTSLIAIGNSYFVILNFIFGMIWLGRLLNDKEASTVYRFIEVLIIQLQIHILFNLICLLFTLFLQTDQLSIFFAFGWFPVICVYEFKKSIKDPEEERKFCWLPFMIKNKHFPWVILLFMVALSAQLFLYAAVAILGYYQEVVRREMLIKLPFIVYLKFEQCLPDSIKSRTDFVRIHTLEKELLERCIGGYNRDAEIEDAVSVVVAGGGGVIGGSNKSSNDFKSFWSNKSEENGTSGSTNNENYEIEPEQQFGNNEFINPKNDGDYAFELNERNQQRDQLLDRQEKKNKKKNLI